tara:strand:+ start:62 stop:673 length:612 start_codon:yes stop_codon:yes gene_type:complete
MTTLMSYKNELTRLTLKKDPGSLMYVSKLKKEWDNDVCDAVAGTKGVNTKNMTKMLSVFGDTFGTPIKIDILNIGLNNLCHNNCVNICEICPEYKVQVGYNITACNCGNLMCMEAHSVIKDKDEKLYDITPDFNREIEKWFVPLNTNKSQKQIVRLFGRKYDFYNAGMRKCKCGIEWTAMPSFVPSEFTNTIEQLNKLKICNF